MREKRTSWCQAGHATSLFVAVLLVVHLQLSAAELQHAGRYNSPATATAQPPPSTAAASLSEGPVSVGYVTVLQQQPVGTGGPSSSSRGGSSSSTSVTNLPEVIVVPLGQVQQQQQVSVKQPGMILGAQASGSGAAAAAAAANEAGRRGQPASTSMPGPSSPPARSGSSSSSPPPLPSLPIWGGGGSSSSSSSSGDDDGSDDDSSSDDPDDMQDNVWVVGSDPLAPPPPPPPSSASGRGPTQQQKQQPSSPKPGRNWDQKFPFAQCADATLTFDVAFIGTVQYAQVGTVRYAYHKFGPLSDTSSSSSNNDNTNIINESASKVIKRKDAMNPVVFIAGWGTSMYIWPIPLLRALAATRTVVLFDNMRTGGSTDTGRQKLTIPMMADSTAGLIQRLKLDKPDIWSWSLGAAVGYALLARHANRISNVILASGTPGGPNALLPPASLWQQVRAAEQNYTALLPFIFPDGAADTGVCSFYAAFNSFQSANQLSSPLGKASLEEQGAALLAFFNDASVVNKLKDRPNRVLILHGVQDRLMPIRNALLGAQQLLGAWMLQFPGEGHAIPFDNVPAMIAMTLEFFSFASPLDSKSLRYWASYGETYNQQVSKIGGLRKFGG